MEFCNAVRFKVKEGCEEEYLQINKSFENLPGQKIGRLLKQEVLCFIGMWNRKKPLLAKENMIGNLDKVRHLLENYLLVRCNDPVSGTVVLDYS